MQLGRHSIWSSNYGRPGGFHFAVERPLVSPNADDAGGAPMSWAPRVDIREQEQRFVIFADIPGVDPSQIEVSMDKGVLSIKGARESNHGEDGKFTLAERAHGAFQRSFALPDSADAEGITATGKHGVLEIVIPKKTLSTPRRITINAEH